MASRGIAAYPISVDYGMNVERAVELHQCNFLNLNISAKNFPTKREGKAKIAIRLVHFNYIISTNGALNRLDRMNYRPAELHELIAFGEKYPNIQREFPVVALGSVWKNLFGYNYVPYLNRNDSKCNLNIIWTKDGWFKKWRFAAVRK